ncbi:ABC transporter substrate-binding protein [bacterium]|nr:ABC transporter substrate-binding protein [bacterium]
MTSPGPAALSQTPARHGSGKRLVVLLGAALLIASGCVGGPTRPTTPTYSGAERPEPSRPDRPDAPQPRDSGFMNPFASRPEAYIPRHVAPNEAAALKRVAVLLPFSSSDAAVRREASGLFNAIQLALFDGGAGDVVLIPKDTRSEIQAAAEAAQEAVREGAIAVVGPLFAPHVAPVAAEAAEARAPVFAFSTDEAALGQGAYLMSLTPKSEVRRIVDWAASEGVTRFAMFGPNSTYGRAVESALREEAGRRGALVISVEYYRAGDTAPLDAAKRLAAVVRQENKAYPGQVAVLIPERGVQLRTVAPLLPYFDVNVRQVKFLGTGAWNDPEVWREPSLFGGAFAAPDPQSVSDFETRYRSAFGEAAPRLASFGYDAGALVAALARNGQLDRSVVERREGFVGVNGLFRFESDGGLDRGLAVLQLGEQGSIRVVSPAVKAFTPGS